MNLETVRALIEQEGVHSIDLKYADLVGNWYHITFPSRRLDHVLRNGIPFDGSSIPGMKSVEAGDMVLLPDPETAILDPFSRQPRLRMLSYICDADTRRGVNK
ncbi:MAG: glutamine synthetase, partial [Xanthomonadales bacterium]